MFNNRSGVIITP